jgi:hypothetical protein
MYQWFSRYSEGKEWIILPVGRRLEIFPVDRSSNGYRIPVSIVILRITVFPDLTAIMAGTSALLSMPI